MLRYLTAGESHGPGLTAILEGIPAGLELSAQDINVQLQRRQKGYGRGARMKIENDAIAIKGGVRHGKTLGSPVALWLENKDFSAWQDEMSVETFENFVSQKVVNNPRPGHADLSGGLKYNHKDLRNVLERASARETAIRVALGAICRKFLKEFAIDVTGHVTNIGSVKISTERPDFESIKRNQEEDPCRCIDHRLSLAMQKKIDAAKESGDTLGGTFEIIFTGLPVGLGSHVHWDRKLDAKMAATLMSIQAVKGVEIGMGFAMADHFGSEVHDPIFYDQNKKHFYQCQNKAGGIVGGMTSGENIVIRAVMKPLSTLYKPLASVDINTKESFEASIERSDTCAVPAACVIAENILCFDIANVFLEKFGGDSLEETRRNFEGFHQQIKSY